MPDGVVRVDVGDLEERVLAERVTHRIETASERCRLVPSLASIAIKSTVRVGVTIDMMLMMSCAVVLNTQHAQGATRKQGGPC